MKRLMIFVIVLSIFVSATEATVINNARTDNQEISCTFETLCEKEAEKFFGIKYLPNRFIIKHERPGGIPPSISYEENEVHTLSRDYMPVKVTVTNSSKSPIHLERDSYLRNIEDVIVWRDKIVDLYPNNSPSNLKAIIYGSISLGAGALLTLFEEVGLNMWKDSINEKFENDLNYTERKVNSTTHYGSYQGGSAHVTSPYKREMESYWLARVFGDLALASAASAGLFMFYHELKTNKKLIESRKKASKNISKKPSLYNNESEKTPIETFSDNSDFFEIPPGKTFRDYFLVDLKRVSRKILSQKSPELIYSKS